jgi:hypothetical protein
MFAAWQHVAARKLTARNSSYRRDQPHIHATKAFRFNVTPRI